jgi:hypothetical protein
MTITSVRVKLHCFNKILHKRGQHKMFTNAIFDTDIGTGFNEFLVAHVESRLA